MTTLKDLLGKRAYLYVKYSEFYNLICNLICLLLLITWMIVPFSL